MSRQQPSFRSTSRHQPLVDKDDSVEVLMVGQDFGSARRHMIAPGAPNHRLMVGKAVGAVIGVTIDGQPCGGTIVQVSQGEEAARRARRIPPLPTKLAN